MTLKEVYTYILTGKLHKFITERKLQTRIIELRLADNVITYQPSPQVYTERNENLFLAQIKDFIFHTWFKGNDGYLYSNQYFFRIETFNAGSIDILE